MSRRLSIFVAVFAVFFTQLVAGSAQAATDSIALYFSAPFVTGSHVTTNATTETFNSFSAGACPTTFTVGSVSHSGCSITAETGTSGGDSKPAIDVGFSSYVGASPDSTITFPAPVKYVGFWWMMGNTSNTVQFIDSTDTVIAEMSASDIMSFLGIGYGSVTNADTGTLSTVDGSTHLRKHYYQAPSTYTGTVDAPVHTYTPTYANEPYVYLNLFVTGAVEVKKIKLSGTGFEFDNFTASTSEQGPTGKMVLSKQVYGAPPATQTISWNPTNTSVASNSGPITPNNLATVVTPATGGGAITYSVIDAGTTGCTVDANSGVISYTALGTCTVRATAAAVDGFYETSKDVTFTITAPPATHTITVTPPTNGTISPGTDANISDASTPTYTITPDAGYQLDSITVDGVPVTGTLSGGVWSYTFPSVTADHVIAATFSLVPTSGSVTINRATYDDKKLKIHYSSTAVATTYFYSINGGTFINARSTRNPLSVNVGKLRGSVTVTIQAYNGSTAGALSQTYCVRISDSKDRHR